ncbi:DUF6708 domain-containing protein [Burkholderia cepacia]|uniref:DUF6708 domain-containing protein n=1 Tax=Burkholderia cepacia TaxID=292 RepID=UPI003D67012C
MFFLFSAFSIFAAWGVYGGAYHIRHKPKDQPIRVNRVRGKVYFSYYKDCPCAPRRGRVTARGYAWEQLRVWTWSTARGHQGIETIAESLRQTKKSSFAVFLMC